MDIKQNSRAKVFDEVSKSAKSMIMQGSTYSGQDEKGKPKFSSWLIRFVGDAFKKSDYLRRGDTIIMNSARVDNIYDKERKKATGLITVFDFDIAEDEK